MEQQASESTQGKPPKNRHERRKQDKLANSKEAKNVVAKGTQTMQLAGEVLKAMQLANLALVEIIRDKLQFEGVNMDNSELMVVQASEDFMGSDQYAAMMQVIQKALSKDVLAIPKGVVLAALDAQHMRRLGWFRGIDGKGYRKFASKEDPSKVYDVLDNCAKMKHPETREWVRAVWYRDEDHKRYCREYNEFMERHEEIQPS